MNRNNMTSVSPKNRDYSNGQTQFGISNGHSSPKAANNGSDDTNNRTCGRCCSCLENVSNFITGGIEGSFARLGFQIGKHPWIFIIVCCTLGCLTAIGLLAFNEVTEPEKLWVPDGSQVLDDKDWIDNNYPSKVRREEYIGLANNILTPTGLAALLDIYHRAQTESTSSGIKLADVCFKAGSDCIVYSILEMWSYNDTIIKSLTQKEIVDTVNTVTISPMYGRSIDLVSYLGGTTTNSSGSVTAADAATMVWLTQGGDEMESTTESWEKVIISIGRAGHPNLTESYINAGRSWDDESGNAIDDDVLKLSIGYFLVIIFAFSVLGRFNLMEQRAWMCLAGFLCVGLAILTSIGLSSAFQQAYGPVQSVLPFLLLGIGVDDMFVIVGSLNNLKEEELEQDIPHIISAVLKHAGVSITVTSFTDFMAFMIGATTIIPALRSFCIYAAMGVLALFLFQSMVFTSFLAIDLYRKKDQRDACCFCIKHPSPPYKANECSKKELVPFLFKRGLAKILTKLPVQIIIVIAALGLFGVNVWGFVELEQYFDPYWFLPTDSYPYQWKMARDVYFPDDGAAGYVYCGNLNYWSHKTEFENLETVLANNKWIYNGTTDSWFNTLTGWLSRTTDPAVTGQLDANKYPVSEAAFINLTYQMSTSVYTRTSTYLKFATNTGSDITASRFPFRHLTLNSASEQIDALDDTRDAVKSVGFSDSQCFPYCFIYMTWEANKVIQEELYRNLLLALICVFLVTLILIANFRTSLFVFLGVLFTLIDVAGTMQFWDLTIDTVTSIILILAIGLSVDYAAHIGHFFMTVKGDRKTRMEVTIGEMGPPVFYAGFSTFLAFILLSDSNSYVFDTFFKVNFLVIVYGLFHGLCFVPVLLCWMGPDPYPHVKDKHETGALGHGATDEYNMNGLNNPAFVKHDENNADGEPVPLPPKSGLSANDIDFTTPAANQNTKPEKPVTTTWEFSSQL